MTTIFKNLWNRRRNNAWLFIELILVTILTWIMVDPVAVSISDTSLPLGYDVDRLVYVSVTSMPADAPGYDGAADSLDRKRAAIDAIMAKVRAYDGVEHATHVLGSSVIGDKSRSSDTFNTGNDAVDTLAQPHMILQYIPGQEYFETYGYKSSQGSPDISEISKMAYDDGNNLIISRQLGEVYWPGQNPLGKRIVLNPWELKNGADTVWGTVRAVIEGARWHSMDRSYALQFGNRVPSDARIQNAHSVNVVLRLRDGVDMDEFLAGFRPWADTGLHIDNFYMLSANPYRSIIDSTEKSYGIQSERALKMLLSGFFLLNLVLGTIGCFWLQTRKRIGEIGVRRAYGARRRHIVGMLLGESALLATLSVLAGVLIYLQWALKYGLDKGFINNSGLNVVDNWVSHFGEHFIIISTVVYAIILVCVLIGTLIPAISASRVSVTDVLRDE